MHETFLAFLYSGGVVVWLMLWWALDGYRLMRANRLLYLPFTLCLLVLCTNAVLWRSQVTVATLEMEESLFNFLDNRSANIIGATGSVMVIATIIYGIRRTQMPKDFIRLQALAFICLLGFSAPVIWIPTQKPHLLMLLRHYQTIPFTYGIFFSVSGILVLLHGLGVDMPRHELHDAEEEKEVEKSGDTAVVNDAHRASKTPF